MSALRGIDIHTYLAKDASRAIAFWRDTMGLVPTHEFAGLGAEFDLPDGSTLGIWKLDDSEGGWVQGNGIMFAVDDVAEAVAYYKTRGVDIEEHIEETPVCFMAFAKDSEGNTFILHHRKHR